MCGALTTYVVVKAPKASSCSGAGARRSAAHRWAARPRSIRTMAAAAGIVLAGGRSSRMGTSKAALEWHGSTLLRRIVGLVARGDDVDVVLPRAGGFPHPLAAAYRTALAPVVERLLAADRLRPAFLFDECRVLRLDEDVLLADGALAAADPALDSVLNLNEPADYEAARARPAPQVTVQRFGPLARNGGAGPTALRAATLGAAAAAAGVTLDEHV